MKLVVELKGQWGEVGKLPNGDAGIAATIAGMQAAIDEAVYGEDGWLLKRVARTIRRGAAATRADVPKRLYQWCQDNIRFQADPPDVELLRLPAQIARAAVYGKILRGEKIGADCDDLAMFACSILAVWGYKPVLITVGRTAQQLGGRFEHVFYGIRGDNGQLTPYDPQENVPPGAWGNVDLQRIRAWLCNVSAPWAKAAGGGA
jgi:hypothetical protein